MEREMEIRTEERVTEVGRGFYGRSGEFTEGRWPDSEEKRKGDLGVGYQGQTPW